MNGQRRLSWSDRVFLILLPAWLVGCMTLPWAEDLNKGGGKSPREVWDDNAALVRDCIDSGGKAIYVEADGHVTEYLGCER